MRKVEDLLKWNMEKENNIKNGDCCTVVGGTHKGKSGAVADLHFSKTGHLTLTVIQESGVKFKTLAKNVIKIC